jgi:hypothetical protein
VDSIAARCKTPRRALQNAAVGFGMPLPEV